VIDGRARYGAGALIVRDEKVKDVPQYVFPFDHIVAVCLVTARAGSAGRIRGSP